MKTKRRFARIMMIAGGFALGLMLQTTVADAGGKHRDRRHGKRGDHRVEHRHDRYGYDYRIIDDVRYDRRHRGHDHYYDRGHRRGHNKHWKRHRHERFRIPNRMVYRSRVDYRPYFYAERFHRGHRHMHMVYRFPVYTDYGVRYRAVSYCDGSYFRTGRFVYNGPRLGFEIRF